jgi:hypothetical protein
VEADTVEFRHTLVGEEKRDRVVAGFEAAKNVKASLADAAQDAIAVG